MTTAIAATITAIAAPKPNPILQRHATAMFDRSYAPAIPVPLNPPRCRIEDNRRSVELSRPALYVGRIVSVGSGRGAAPDGEVQQDTGLLSRRRTPARSAARSYSRPFVAAARDAIST